MFLSLIVTLEDGMSTFFPTEPCPFPTESDIHHRPRVNETRQENKQKIEVKWLLVLNGAIKLISFYELSSDAQSEMCQDHRCCQRSLVVFLFACSD